MEAPDLLAARDAGLQVGLRVVRVEQPWLVAGKRVAEAPARLDLAWTAVCAALAGPLVVGGRSAGARVACRTATTTEAVAVLCLAFPLVPRGRTASREAELARPDVPVLVVQGSRDVFGVPAGAHVVTAADHAFSVRKMDGRTSRDVTQEVQAVVAAWLAQMVT